MLEGLYILNRGYYLALLIRMMAVLSVWILDKTKGEQK